MKMVEVCKVFENAGMGKASSVMATGNILFSSEKSVLDLKPILEKAMSEYFDYNAFLFIKSDNEIADILQKNPFIKSEESNIYVFVGIENIENLLLEEFSKCKKSPNEKGEIVENTFYWKVERGSTLGSEFGEILGKKSLKDAITSRNLNTFEKILKKAL